jgi:glyoxylase-like metal-dependent hydrolase (beta-lactamase superfamily II)
MRRRAVLGCVVLLLVGATAVRAQQQQDLAQVEITTIPVAPGLYLLQGAGGNMAASVGEDGIVLVDDQFAPLAPKILAALGRLSPKPLRFVINTHWHGDHTGGNEALGGAGAVIVAHGNVRKRMSVPQLANLTKREIPASPPASLPVVTFAEDVTLHFNGEQVHVFHVADAHTDGDAIVHFQRADALHFGDTLFVGSYPFIDGNSGGTLPGLVAALDRALPLVGEQTRVIPGHGPLSGRAEVVAYRDMLATVHARLAAALAAGKSLEQVQAERPTREFDERYAGGFFKPEVFVERAYRDLQAAAARQQR